MKYNSTRKFLKEVESLSSQGMIKEFNKKFKEKRKFHDFCIKFGHVGRYFYNFIMRLKEKK